MADIMLINVTEGAPAGGFASDGSSEYSYLNSVLPAYLMNDFHYTFCAEPVYYMQLASEIRKAGMSVEVVDGIMQNLRADDIKSIIKDSNTRIFGLTMFQANYRVVIDVISYIKQVHPDSIVFSGGTYSSIVYDKLLLRHDEIDYVVVGDGDEAVPDLCKYLLYGVSHPRNIPGIAYKESQTIRMLPPKPVSMDNISYLARDFSKEILEYQFSFSMVTSRGCGHGVCSFCYLPMYQKNANHPKFRYRKPQDVVGEMRYLKDTYGVNRITFVDEDYFGEHSVGIPRAVEIADMLISEHLEIGYYVNARINSLIEIIKRGLLPKFAQSGLKYVFVGIESGSDEILKKYKKGTSVEKINTVVDQLAQYGIKINPGLITFDPELTLNQVCDNVKMLRYIGYYDVFMFTRKLILLPGIKMGEINQGWELPSIHDEELFEERYFKHSETALLYDAMVWFRDTIFPYYKIVYDAQKISDEIRKMLIENHFSAFESAVNFIREKGCATLEEVCIIMGANVSFVQRMVENIC